MIFISHSWAQVLFDAGFTHSLISLSFATSLQLEMNLSTSLFLLTTPMGRVGEVSMICMSCCGVFETTRFLQIFL